MSFDITSILNFQPPGYICPACRGLFARVATDYKVRPITRSCPVCEVQYVDTANPSSTAGNIYSLFSEGGSWVVDHKGLFEHATSLAQVVQTSRGTRFREAWPTTRLFLEVISRAKYFVHFTSWGISHVMIGALKMASMRVPVYGFVSNVEGNTRAELTEYPRETPNMSAKVIPSTQNIYDAPHQKLVIVDGLVAFKGSMNLTNAGLRRADRGLDISDVETDFTKVTELNNKYFAPVWREITSPADTYEYSSEPPPF